MNMHRIIVPLALLAATGLARAGTVEANIDYIKVSGGATLLHIGNADFYDVPPCDSSVAYPLVVPATAGADTRAWVLAAAAGDNRVKLTYKDTCVNNRMVVTSVTIKRATK